MFRNLINRLKKVNKKLLIVLVVILVVVAIGFSRRGRPIEVESAQISKGQIVEAVSTSGKVNADRMSDLTFQSPGQVAWVGVKNGQKVFKGQGIASLNTVILSVAYQQASNNLRLAQAQVEKTHDDVKGHSGDEDFATKVERTAAEVNYDNTFDQVTAAKQALLFATITAPFNGVIANVTPSSPGINVTPATARYTLVDPTSVYFESEIEEGDLSKIKVGQKVEVTLDAYPEEKFQGVVVDLGFVAFTSSTGGNAYRVRISLPITSDLKFRVGMEGDSEIVQNIKENVLTVDSSAIVSDADKNYVWINDAGKAMKIEVQLGASSIDKVEIISGLNEGQIVLINPPSTLKDGNPIVVK